MTALHSFAGVRPWLDEIAQEAERAQAVAAAHAIIRSRAPHRVADIRKACAVLLTYGDADQRQEAADMLDALALRARRITVKPAPPPYSNSFRMARDVLVGAAVTVWAVYFLLIVVMA